MPGVELIQNDSENESSINEIDSTFDIADGNFGLLGQIANFLKSHDVKINLSEIIKKDDVEQIYKNVENAVNLVQNKGVSGRISNILFCG